MLNLPSHAYVPKLAVATVAIVTCLGCGDIEMPEIPEITELTAQTYGQYKADKGDAWFDPRGASDIFQRTAFEGDGYDAWWRFKVSHDDFVSIASTIAKAENGPQEIVFSNEGVPPAEWKPGAEVPDWWRLPIHDDLQSLQWCFRAGNAGRHHGWFLLHERYSSQAFVWHWNHQWSTEECP